ncbi:MAG TPA: hypothetical protein VFK70_03415 [Vicinamibacteria bacterium]|nr:hypothetical protein [Vicinamibacteria bacterium]
MQDLRCSRCDTVLAGTPVKHTEPARVVPIAAPSRGLRALVAVGVVVALAAGLWVRSLFRGASLNSVEASTAAAPEAPAPQPTWTPPALSYPPIVGYNQGVPSSMAALAIQGGPLPTSAPAATSAEPAGMTSIAPPSEPTRRTAFTNDDLVRMRGQGAPVVAMPAAATAAPPAPAAGAAFVPAVSSEAAQDKLREWTKRVRDAEDDVQEAQAKVRRTQAEVEARRAHALAVASDVDAHDKAQRDVTDSLEDLEKAERKLSEKQRDLDETRAQARAAGIRFEG